MIKLVNSSLGSGHVLTIVKSAKKLTLDRNDRKTIYIYIYILFIGHDGK